MLGVSTRADRHPLSANRVGHSVTSVGASNLTITFLPITGAAIVLGVRRSHRSPWARFASMPRSSRLLTNVLEKFAPDTPVTMTFRKAHFASGHDLKDFAGKLGIALEQADVEQ
jgi:hypothetical protein